MLVSELVSLFYDIAPSLYQESYDNTGLLIGDPKNNISATLITLDVTEDVVNEAIEKKCNVILAHHPLIFSGVKKITPVSDSGRTIIKAIRNDIGVIAMHTNIDNVYRGVSCKMAEKLNLKKIRVLSPRRDILYKLAVFCPKKEAAEVRNALFAAGAGRLGDYDGCSFNIQGTGTFRAGEEANPYVGEIGELHEEKEVKIEVILPGHLKNVVIKSMIEAHPYEEVAYDIFALDNESAETGSGAYGVFDKARDFDEVLSIVKKAFDVKMVKHTQPHKKIKRVAVCGGSGSHLLQTAKAVKADLFISADFSYHKFFEAENSMVVMDIGHFESEQCVKELFYEILSEKKCNFAIHFSEVNTNPIIIS